MQAPLCRLGAFLSPVPGDHVTRHLLSVAGTLPHLYGSTVYIVAA